MADRADRRKNTSSLLLLVLILAAGAALRLYGLNWDDGHWLHPDERQIYFTALDLGWPDSLAQALSPDSPLNPKFFAYGSLPIYLLKGVAVLLGPLFPVLGDEGNLHLVGRPLAVLFDLGTIYLTYRLAQILWPTFTQGWRKALQPRIGSPTPSAPTREHLQWGPLLAATLVSLAVLHVQLAHFYTADPLLAFFVMLTLNLAADVAQNAARGRRVALGIALGLALATKVSAAPLVLSIAVALAVRPQASSPASAAELPFTSHHYRWADAIRPLAMTLLLALGVFFLAQPYALIDWQTFFSHTLREAQIARGWMDVPYTIQYAGTMPFLYPMWQTALWGLALLPGLVAWLALAMALIRWLRLGSWRDTLLLAWAGVFGVLTGLLYAKYLRYFLPLVPVLMVLAVLLFANFGRTRASKRQESPPVIRPSSFVIATTILVLPLLAYALLFVQIYAEPHSWIAASEWLYQEVPSRSTLAVEHWDRALPLPLELEGVSRRAAEYDVRILTLYDEPDDAAKWETLAADLAASDHLVIASRRLYGSIPRVPNRYPLASRYYHLLFSGGLGFELVAEFTRGPQWLNPRIPPSLHPAPALLRPDESFVVYDHPRALIFANRQHLPAAELLRRLNIP
jgi:hypothetical protein